MKTKMYFTIAFRLILLFTSAMILTFLTDSIRDFLGDKIHVCGSDCATAYSKCKNSSDMFDKSYDWGIRHYWYFWMLVSLFILSAIDLVIHIVNLIDKNYPQ